MSINRKKKMIRRIVWISMLFILGCNPYVRADDEDETEIFQNEMQEILVETTTKPITTKEPQLNARAAIIYDRTTKEIIWGKNEMQKRAMASTTKIMTAMVVLENSNLSDIVTISQKAAGTGGSRLKINTGDKLSIQDLLYGLMLRSRQ